MQIKPNLPLIDETEEDLYQNWTIDKMMESIKDNQDDYVSGDMKGLEWKMSTSSNTSVISSIQKWGKIKKPLNIVFKETAE